MIWHFLLEYRVSLNSFQDLYPNILRDAGTNSA